MAQRFLCSQISTRETRSPGGLCHLCGQVTPKSP
ncbi:hypothetical protein T09_7207 [Trichinella sp. T9]|nr:hypothetical protein T09_7207 [Trichinella sp. T9]